MASIEHPGDVVRELTLLRNRADEAVTALYTLEKEAVLAEIDADRIEAEALLNATGTIPERNAQAKLASLDARKTAELARVKVSYAKNRLKQLSESVMAVQTSARLIEMQWRTAGIGER
jgi:hypothetical protein